MVQVQVSITFENQKLVMRCYRLSREDVSEIETQAAYHLEKMIEGAFIGVAKQEGLRVRTKRIKAK